jgi:hypothetical protein
MPKTSTASFFFSKSTSKSAVTPASSSHLFTQPNPQVAMANIMFSTGKSLRTSAQAQSGSISLGGHPRLRDQTGRKATLQR